MNKDLYGKFEDSELRGGVYYTGILSNDITIRSNPHTWTAQGRQGDKLILKQLDEDTFIVCAILRQGEWRNPMPSYNDPNSKYEVQRKYIQDLTPRL